MVSTLVRSFAVAFMFCGTVPARAVDGRFVRVEAPISIRMEPQEIEVFTGGMNIALDNRKISFTGTGFEGRSITEQNKHRPLIDGKFSPDGRGERMERPDKAVGPWVEMDFGKVLPLDKIVVKQVPNAVYADRGLRLVTVLDEKRRVVAAMSFDVRELAKTKGVVEVRLGDAQVTRGPWIGTVLPENAAEWASLRVLLDVTPAPTPPNVEARFAAFSERNEPAAIQQLARQFFARVNLDRPELREVKQLVADGKSQAALDAFRDHFLAKIQRVAFLHEHPRPPLAYVAEADDLVANVMISMTFTDATAWSITPGKLDWAYAPSDDKKPVELARQRAMVGVAIRALLTRYRETGRVEYLRQWAALADDWGLNLKSDLERSSARGIDLRDYFVKETLQEFNHFATELAETARRQPAFARELPSATLARVLMPVLEEYLPPYWFVCRRAAFNHTFNALDAGYVTSRVLDDFHAGQRLAAENRQHWQKLWSQNLTRDGSMIEIGDEGHLDMHLRTGVFFEQMKKDRPEWFTPSFQSEFQDGFAQSIRYLARHMTPNGCGHRYGFGDHFPRLWAATDAECSIGNMIPRPTINMHHVFQEPEMRNIVQAVFAPDRHSDRSRTRESSDRRLTTSATAQIDSPERAAASEAVAKFYANDPAPQTPRTVSDWMPYAGLAYLRQSWRPDAPFLNLIGQPPGHSATGSELWNTEYRFWSGGHPLLHVAPVYINSQPQCAEFGKQTMFPGSKTDRLSTSSEFPAPSRWHSGPLFDFAETAFEGTYLAQSVNARKQELAARGEPVHDMRAARWVIQLRPLGLFVTTDRVARSRSRETSDASNKPATSNKPTSHEFGYDKPHRLEIPYLFWQPQPDSKRGAAAPPSVLTFDKANNSAVLQPQNAPGVIVHPFATAPISWQTRGPQPHWWSTSSEVRADFLPPAFSAESRVLQAEAAGPFALSTILEPQPADGGSRTIKKLTSLSTAQLTGFRAEMKSGARLTWLASASGVAKLAADGVEVDAEGLLVWRDNNETHGVVLGHVGWALLPVSSPTKTKATGKSAHPTDFVFSPTGIAPIHRPISPVTFGPVETVFIDTTNVTLTSATPGVVIHYTTDGSEPTATSPRYSQPLTLRETTNLQARAFRDGVTEIPFTAAGTDVTVISHATFTKSPLLAAQTSVSPRPATGKGVGGEGAGLRTELVRDTWYALVSHLNLPDVLPGQSLGQAKLLDPSLAERARTDADGPFGIRQSGFLSVPADGVYTFHAPSEYIGASCEPGYDLRVWVAGHEWDLGQRFHNRGRWSIPLAKGRHPFVVTFADARHRDHTMPNAGLWRGYPTPWVVWKGDMPQLELSGPNFARQPIPDNWLRRD